MHYELWGHNPGNLLAEFDAESEALAFVRELLEDGWSPSDLSLGLEYTEGDPEDVPLPPVLTGATLLERVRAAA
jgi:hypothetical protein